MALTLARDDKQSVLQVGSYNTTDYQNLASGSVTPAFVFDRVVRIVNTGTASWIARGTDPTAIDGEGLLMLEGSELTMLVYKDEKLAVIGGTLNIVPVAI